MMRFIEVVQYSKNWPQCFDMAASTIKNIIGNNCIDVHHIGSTSIEGLSAKPVIDVMPVVRSIRNVDQLKDQFQQFGYEWRGELGIPMRRYLQLNDGDLRIQNIHIFEEGNPEIEKHITFRNWMRSHPDACAQYGELKGKLAKKFPHDILGYGLGKDDFIQTVLCGRAGFNNFTMARALTPHEWQRYHAIRAKILFEPQGLIYDKNHSTIDNPHHYHMVLRKGREIIGAVQIEFLPESKDVSLLRTFAIDQPAQGKGYGAYMLKFVEKWLKSLGVLRIKLHAKKSAEGFYRKHGYQAVDFSEENTGKNVVDLGKLL